MITHFLLTTNTIQKQPMIITNQIRTSIVSQLFKIMRITTKYDYIPDDRLKKQLLIKEQACLDKSATIHDYLGKINFIIYSINKDTGMNTAPIRYEDLSLPRPSVHTQRNNINYNINSYSKPSEYSVYSNFQPRQYPTNNPIIRKRVESEKRSNNTGVKSAFNQIYDIYTLTNSQETINTSNFEIPQNTSNKQIKNNLMSNVHNMQKPNTQPQFIDNRTIIKENEKEVQFKKRPGLQEAKDAVINLLNASHEMNTSGEDNHAEKTKKLVKNENFRKLIDSYSIEEFLEEIKDTDISPAELKSIETFYTKMFQLSYKIRLLFIEAGNPGDFSDYKKIRDIFEYQIENTSYIFIDDFFLEEAEEIIYELSNKSRRVLLKEQSSLKIEDTYDSFIANTLNR